MKNTIQRYRNQPSDVTITLSEFDWLRIRAALLSAAEDCSAAGNSDQEQQYFSSYRKVKEALAELF